MANEGWQQFLSGNSCHATSVSYRDKQVFDRELKDDAVLHEMQTEMDNPNRHFLFFEISHSRGRELRFLWSDQPRSSERHLLAEEFSPGVICASRGEQFSLQWAWIFYDAASHLRQLGPDWLLLTGHTRLLLQKPACLSPWSAWEDVWTPWDPILTKTSIQFGLFSQIRCVDHDAGKSDLHPNPPTRS